MMYHDRKLARLTRNTKLLQNWQKLVLNVLPSLSIVLAIFCHFRATIYIYPLPQLVVRNQLSFHLSFANHCYHTGGSWVYHLLYPQLLLLYFFESIGSIISMHIYISRAILLIGVGITAARPSSLDLFCFSLFSFSSSFRSSPSPSSPFWWADGRS